MAKSDVKKANATRAQKKAAVHSEKSESRKNDIQFIKAAYLSGKGEFIIEDLQVKIKAWMSMNNKIAQDGVGNRPTGYKLQDGSPEVETIYLTPEQRASYLDQSKGMQAILDYIDRQVTQPEPDQKPKKKQAKAE